MQHERNLQDANVVFFGGTAGIGQAAAVEIARRHANILVIGRAPDAGAATVATLMQAGAASAAFVRGDLSTIAGISEAAEAVLAWKPVLHGVVHSAMAAQSGRHINADGLDFAFVLQYLARVMLNRLLVDALSASGDGRIIHISGAVGEKQLPDLDDLQFEHTKWSLFKSLLGSHALSFLHIQEASRRWSDRPVTVIAACVGPTKTKLMLDSKMPLIMRLLGMIGAKPEASARNAVTALVKASAADARGAVLRKPKSWTPAPITFDTGKATKLWDITTALAAKHGVALR
ncbi:SDR family NAD(P)-dependent oxidoreductase [Pseudomonas nunensis]|uniref:SDR family NAD(P)-dependent oxidoreductase n=1 Tax=Pseudomonas nunensis TaxID=2961896 RepID=UPI0025B1BBCC|nr:SDR family NAD(P)-dependent oxidoreductase [Pseudomonas nunensis]MDN3219651.1 SDR family NAD(P)-dependent oxidoreductase [Pseudomonas nunensis]